MTADTLPVLNWIPRFDDESMNYRIRTLSATPEDLKGRNRLWKRDIWLDQGSEGACTGFGFSHCYGTTPRRKIGVTDDFAKHRYYRAREEDEWAGEDYEGSSVLGAMKAANKDGLIASYHWATSLAELVYALSYHGPVEAGTNWYSGMWNPDNDGFLHVAGQVVGGHAYCIGGVSMTGRFFWIYNSWGKEWGLNGAAKISFTDMERLLKEWGEFALMKKPRTPNPASQGVPLVPVS